MSIYDVIKTKSGKVGTIIFVYPKDDFEVEYEDGSLDTIPASDVVDVIHKQ